MARTTKRLLPSVAQRLTKLGERTRLARLRRKFSSATVAARAGITRTTLYRIERGDATVAIRNYVSVLAVLQLDADLDLVARDDELGRRLQDLEMPTRRRAPRRSSGVAGPGASHEKPA